MILFHCSAASLQPPCQALAPRIKRSLVFLNGSLIFWLDCTWNFTYRDVMFFPSWIIPTPDMYQHLDLQMDVVIKSTLFTQSHTHTFVVSTPEVRVLSCWLKWPCVFSLSDKLGVTFPVKIPVIRQRDTQDVFHRVKSTQRQRFPWFILPLPRPARPACVNRTFPPDAQGIRVCEVRKCVCAHLVPISIFIWLGSTQCTSSGLLAHCQTWSDFCQRN